MHKYFDYDSFDNDKIVKSTIYNYNAFVNPYISTN
jgi:hypothetical protein